VTISFFGKSNSNLLFVDIARQSYALFDFVFNDQFQFVISSPMPPIMMVGIGDNALQSPIFMEKKKRLKNFFLQNYNRYKN
jgi:hypothetical protein